MDIGAGEIDMGSVYAVYQPQTTLTNEPSARALLDWTTANCFCSVSIWLSSAETVACRDSTFASNTSNFLSLPLSSSSACAAKGAKATTKPAAINDRRMVRLAVRPNLLSFPVRKQRLISLAVALPLIAVVFATPILARSSSLSFIFDSGKLVLAKNRSVTAKIHQGSKPRSLVRSDMFHGFREQTIAMMHIMIYTM